MNLPEATRFQDHLFDWGDCRASQVLTEQNMLTTTVAIYHNLFESINER